MTPVLLNDVASIWNPEHLGAVTQIVPGGRRHLCGLLAAGAGDSTNTALAALREES
jgi:hypothetical protein